MLKLPRVSCRLPTILLLLAALSGLSCADEGSGDSPVEVPTPPTGEMPAPGDPTPTPAPSSTETDDGTDAPMPMPETGGAGGAGGASGGGGAPPLGGAGGEATGGSSGEAAGGNGGAPDAPTPEERHYYGRWKVNEDGSAVTVNSGSYIGARFEGTGLSASFDISMNQQPRPTLAWRIDDMDWMEAGIAEQLVLAEGLAAGEHEVTLLVRGMDETQSRWSAPLVASVTFSSFDIDGGALVPSARPDRPKLEFIGDSITEGVNVSRAGPNGETGRTWRADALRAYPAQTAMAMDAEWRQVGFGFHGVTREGNGGVPRAADSFDWFFEGVPLDDWQADVVIINEGTNDRGANATEFRTQYGRLITAIRAAYAEATIVALRPFSGAQADAIQAVVQEHVANGDMLVRYVDTTGWIGAADLSDRLHPNVMGGQTIRDKLAPVLEDLL